MLKFSPTDHEVVTKLKLELMNAFRFSKILLQNRFIVKSCLHHVYLLAFFTLLLFETFRMTVYLVVHKRNKN